MIFGKFEMEKYVTKGVREDLNRFIETQQNVTVHREERVQDDLQVIGTPKGDRMNQAC